jgi:3-isopropylmalate/(R)-2-methylmalate dehydratase small subunit
MGEDGDTGRGAIEQAHRERGCIEGLTAWLPIGNLDTDQIMPKQFLRGTDKAGLAGGLLYDLRFTPDGNPRESFVLNQPDYAGCRILLGADNFGCGSSREHAVWGLMQFGIKAVIAPSFGEIFYSNAMNNGLLLAAVPGGDVDLFAAEIVSDPDHWMQLDVATLRVCSHHHTASFSLSARHRRMFLEGLDLMQSTLTRVADIAAFEKAHWARQPWLRSMAETLSGGPRR